MVETKWRNQKESMRRKWKVKRGEERDSSSGGKKRQGEGYRSVRQGSG